MKHRYLILIMIVIAASGIVGFITPAADNRASFAEMSLVVAVDNDDDRFAASAFRLVAGQPAPPSAP